MTITLNDLSDDSVQYNGIAGKISRNRYVVLNGCEECPLVIDRNTINYGIILTGERRKPIVHDSRLHSWSYAKEVKEYFDIK